jgi:hypothetical protein
MFQRRRLPGSFYWIVLVCQGISDCGCRPFVCSARGLDHILDESVILQMKCCVHMTSVVFVNTITNTYSTQMIDESRQAQRIPRMQPIVDAVGRK